MAHESPKARASLAGKAAFGDGWRIDGWAIAPGRIELIGNHIDYNGGPVLAGAIDRVVAIGSGSIDDPRAIAIIAADLSNEMLSFEPLSLGDWRASDGETGPVVYIKGIVAALSARSIPFRTGVGLAIAGDVPRGFGMSSSAALCIATILALTIDEMDPREMVAVARDAEHRAGSPVGAMDQSASVAGNVILFDGRDNSFTAISPELGDHVFAVAGSGIDRSLRTSAYGTRVKESERALERLAHAYGLQLPNLSALNPRWLEVEPTIRDRLGETLAKRVRHVVTETQRVHEAERALRSADWVTFGELMNASGESSANDYEISHPEVEKLVRLLRQQEGVLGARMMGGGEGGPALALLRKDVVGSVSEALNRGFYASRRPAGDESPFQVCAFGPGAHREKP